MAAAGAATGSAGVLAGAAALLGLNMLPSTATAIEAAACPWAQLAILGLVALLQLRRRLGTTWESAAT
jgi:hypothetical protein